MFPPKSNEAGSVLDLQHYLQSNTDPDSDEHTGKFDDSTTDAQHSIQSHPILGRLLCYPLAGQHSCLLYDKFYSFCPQNANTRTN